MTPSDPDFPPVSAEMWDWLCGPVPIRADVVAQGRTRFESDDWPPALAVADAVLLAWRHGMVQVRPHLRVQLGS